PVASEIEACEAGEGGERLGPLVSDVVALEIKAREAGEGGERLGPFVSDPVAPEIEVLEPAEFQQFSGKSLEGKALEVKFFRVGGRACRNPALRLGETCFRIPINRHAAPPPSHYH